MPRNLSGVFSLPAGSIVTDGVDDILASQHNDPLQDIEADMNMPRPVVAGGTGASTAANARTNLGLGTIATQNANAVSVTGGSITGITDLAVADGGTGASTAANARTNLGAAASATTITAGDGLTGGGDLSANRTVAVDSSVVRTSRTLTAGNGLTGGGDLTANRTVTMGTPTTLTGSTTNAVTTSSHTHEIDSTIARSAITITAGNGLSGGGNLSANRTVTMGTPTSLTATSTNAVTTSSHTHEIDSTIARSAITVSAGNGLTGGGNLTANRTLTVGAGDGISVGASSVAVDSTVVRTTGTQSIGGAKTFTSDAQFDGNIRVGDLDTSTTGVDGFRVQKLSSVTYVFTQCRAAELASTPIISHFRGSSAVFRVLADGDVVNTDNSYGAISDARLKTDIESCGPQIDDLRQIEVVKYRKVDDPEGPRHVGVIAQQLQKIKPGLVSEDQDGMLSVKYSVFVPLLLKAVQELAAKVDALEARE
jgi:hypothetical protein